MLSIPPLVLVRAQNGVGAPREPPLSRPSATLSQPCGERAGRGVPIWFMVPMRAQKRKEAFHEPQGRAGCAQPAGPRRGEDTAPYPLARFMAPIHAKHVPSLAVLAPDLSSGGSAKMR